MNRVTVKIAHRINAKKNVIDHRSELVGRSWLAFKSRKAFVNFMLDVDKFYDDVIEGNRNPHTWDKLLSRARKHGFSDIFRRYDREFSEELKIYWQCEKEGIDQRGMMQ